MTGFPISRDLSGGSDAESLARTVRACRLRAGLSQEELAHRTQLSVRTIANIEAARVGRPHSYSLSRLADGLGLTGRDRESLLSWPHRSTDIEQRDDSGSTGAGIESAERAWTTPSPRQLPADIGDFTGRVEEMRQISAHLTQHQPRRPPLTVLSGQAGIGKTTIAVRVGHAVADAFPDGQLFADLGGLTSPQDPAVVLGWFLRALGVDAASVPPDVAERTALFRSLVADRRVVIVLDDAAGADQVRPLLSGTGASATIITSRVRLDALESGRTFDLQLFTPTESLTLLTRLLTAGRVQAEQAAAHDIVRSCGHLPLAVRIAAARLAARPDMSLAAYASRLADEHRRLDQLRLGDLEVRASIELSYVTLEAVDKVALTRLSLVDVPSLSAWVLAPLVNDEKVDSSAIADRLAERRLLDVVGTDPSGEPRYRVHDLVRLFALQRLHDDSDEQTRLAALQRALGLWLVVAETITDALPTTSDLATTGEGQRWRPPLWFVDELRRAPREWFRADRMNLAAAVRAANANGLHRQAWQIAGAMASPCLLYGDYDILGAVLDVAGEACRRGRDAVGESTMLAAAGRLRQELCDLNGAHRLFQEAYRGFKRAGELRGQAFAAVFVADSLRALQQRRNASDFGEAERWGTVARDLYEKLGDTAKKVDAGYVLGKIFVAQGRRAAAQDCFRTVLKLGDQLDKPIVRAHALFQLGRIARTSRRLFEATPAYREALDIAEGVGDLRSVAFIAYELATAEAEQGEVCYAIRHTEQAMNIYRALRVEERMDQAKSLFDELTATQAG
jgi:transcriptional regulator with XRE-family HTH domain/tetratricopeptide (TPR) repeat protein